MALVLEPSGGGSGRHVLDLARGLEKRGHRVTIFWSPLRAESSFVEALHDLRGVTDVQVMMLRSVGFHDVAGISALRSAIERYGPFDVLHGHSSKAGALVRLLPKRIPGLRVYTPHAIRTMDPQVSARGRFAYKTLETWLARGGAPIIAVSEAERRHCISLGIAADQIHLVPNGADPSFPLSSEEARRDMQLPDDAIAVGFIGRMVEQKDPLRFVEVIRRAHAREPRVRGVMMGDGPLFDAVKASAVDVPITLMGWCNATSLCPGLDMLCVTSRYEALAYSFLEALHAGVPIVSTRVGGVEETVREGRSGRVLPRDASPIDVADAVALLASDDDERSRLAAGALELARTLTIDTMVDATASIFGSYGAGMTDAA